MIRQVPWLAIALAGAGAIALASCIPSGDTPAPGSRPDSTPPIDQPASRPQTGHDAPPLPAPDTARDSAPRDSTPPVRPRAKTPIGDPAATDRPRVILPRPEADSR